MRIVDRKTFLAMPSGTVFSKYAPCYFEELQIKEDSYSGAVGPDPIDFWSVGIASAIKHRGSDEFLANLTAMEKKGLVIGMDFNSCTRDGCFDQDQLFAVWEIDDIYALITRLQQCLHVATPPAVTPEKQGD
jgi:hypothetical protein